MLTRVAWVHAGHVSASDWRLPLEIKQKKDAPFIARERSDGKQSVEASIVQVVRDPLSLKEQKDR